MRTSLKKELVFVLSVPLSMSADTWLEGDF